MWLFTKTGFVSAVAHRNKHGVILVRARDKESLTTLINYCGSPDLPNAITHTPNADYPYRLEIDRSYFARWLTDTTYELDYDNFKNEVHYTRGDDFAAPLHKVWAIMHDVEDDTARNPRPLKKVTA